jgi:high-affinity nickel permease
MGTASLMLLGLALGVRHATDPDHVAAVASIVGGERSIGRAARVGALWGLGHSATILLVGGAIVAFRFAVPARLGLSLELAVAIMLIVLGARALRQHDHGAGDSIRRPLFVGFIHGLAGSAFVALLVVSATRSALAGVGYLAVFGLGTIVGMALITMGVTMPALFAARRFPSTQRFVRLAAGVASIVMGLLLAHQITFVDGLFAAVPHWNPQ